MIIDRKNNEVRRIIKADSGKLGIGENLWSLSNVTVYEFNPDSSSKRQFKKHLSINIGKNPSEIANQMQSKTTLGQENFTYSDITEQIQSNGKKLNYLIRFYYIRKFDDPRMTDVVIIDIPKNSTSLKIINAKSGINNYKRLFNLSDGKIYEINTKSEYVTITSFQYLKLGL